MELIDTLRTSSIIPIVKIQNSADAISLTRSLISAGISTIEFSWHAGLVDCVKAIVHHIPQSKIGICGLSDPAQFQQAAEAGAHYVSSVGFTPNLKAAAEEFNITYIPGVMTPCEIMAVKQMGYHVLKFFPAEMAGGVKTLKSLAQVFPDVYFCPVGGITRVNMRDYLAIQNVIAVNSNWIAPENLVIEKNWDAIRTLAREAALGGRVLQPVW